MRDCRSRKRSALLFHSLETPVWERRLFERSINDVKARLQLKATTSWTWLGLLDGSSAWHAAFLNHAVGQSELLRNLATLRQRIVLDDESFDRRLIAGLAGGGDVDVAEEVFRYVSEAKSTFASSASRASSRSSS